VPHNLKRFYGSGDLHFVTFSCERRFPHLGSAKRRDLFLRALEKIRQDYQLTVAGYVVMPEHVHLLLSEPERKNLSVALKALKQSVSRRMLGSSRNRVGQGSLFGVEALPKRFWQPRFYDFNVWTEKKRSEKLRYMHRNPVKRGLVKSPGEWRWSSFRHYAMNEAGVVAVNVERLPKWARATTMAVSSHTSYA
jgi:putative transposase